MKQVVTAASFFQDRVFHPPIFLKLSSSNLNTIQTDIRVSEHALASVHA